MVTLHEVITFLVSMQISISSLQTHNVNRCGRSRHLARKLLMLICILTKKDRKSGSAGMPRPISYAVFCLKKKNVLKFVPSNGTILHRLHAHGISWLDYATDLPAADAIPKTRSLTPTHPV